MIGGVARALGVYRGHPEVIPHAGSQIVSGVIGGTDDVQFCPTGHAGLRNVDTVSGNDGFTTLATVIFQISARSAGTQSDMPRCAFSRAYPVRVFHRL